MHGYRKIAVLGACLASLLGGLALVRGDANAVGIYTPFAAAVVASGGWFFQANVAAKKAGVGS